MLRSALSLTLLFVLALTACGGHAAHSLAGKPAGQVVMLPAAKAQLPAVPDPGHFVPQRMTSQAAASLPGDGFDSAAHFGINGSAVDLSTSTAGQLAYALYRFPGTPGEAIQQVHYDGANLTALGQVWVGIANYTTNRWDFLTPQTTNSADLPVPATPGQYTSPNGNVYIIVGVFDLQSFSVQNVSVTYPQRYTVSGQVLDNTSTGIGGVTVTSTFANLSTTTDASGNYTLTGLPDGTWPIMATKDSWTFYSNPNMTVVNGADVANANFTGWHNSSHFLPQDPGGQLDNALDLANNFDLFSGPETGTLSVVDDTIDYYKFHVPSGGTFYLEFDNPAGDIYFPSITLYTGGGAYMNSSYTALRGTICVPLLLNDAPADYIVSVGCNGGGGHYTLQLASGGVQSLALHAEDGGVNLTDGALVTVTNTFTTYTTDYILNAVGDYTDYYRPAVSTSAAPSFPGYTFAPPSNTTDLSTGPKTLNFSTTQASYADSLEPNDTLGEADTIGPLALPYDSVGAGNTLSIQETTDYTDFYKVVPAAGQGFRVHVSTAQLSAVTSMLNLFILNSTGSAVAGSSYLTADGREARLDAPADGNPYYVEVRVSNSGAQRLAYTMRAQTYTPYSVKVHVARGVDPIENAVVSFRDGNHTWKFDQSTDVGGVAPPFYAFQGEDIQVEIFRYGLNIDRQTREVTIGTSSAFLDFVADPSLSQDTFEPNDEPATAPQHILPLDADCTLSPRSDYVDCFRVQKPDARPLLVTCDSPSHAGTFDVDFNDSAGNYITDRGVQAGSAGQLFDVGAAAEYQLQVYNPGFDTPYSLHVTSVDAFHIKGSITFAGSGVPGTLVHCDETGASTSADPVTGAYDLGLFLPGTYTVETYHPGFSPAPAPAVVPVGAADATQNFTLTAAPQDAGEPNDSPATAHSITPDGTLTTGYTLGTGTDTTDYYKFDATAGQRAEISLSWAQAWWNPPVINDVLDPGMNSLGGSLAADNGQLHFGFVAPTTGTYTFEVTNGPVDYGIKVSLN